MFRFHKLFDSAKDGVAFQPVSPRDSDEDLQARVGRLAGDEYEVYKWLREFYSEQWIAETLLLDARATKEKIKSVYSKLGVKNKRALLRTYGRLERPQKGPVNTDAIDSYIDARAEKEIQDGLETTKGGNEDG